MSARRSHRSILRRLGRRVVMATLLLFLLAGFPAASHAAQTPHLNAAGLVIKHGDGSVLYFYVQFSEPKITGTELLERAGVSVAVAPYVGLGQAVCRLDGEGCPNSNCFCKSYGNPSVYWRYHKLSQNGYWVPLPYGPDQRTIRDGDVDGWSWSAKQNDLPPITLDQIARTNGIIGSPMATPSPTATALQPTQPQAVVSPAVLGVEVQPSGQTSSIHPEVKKQHTNATNYLWFGAGLVGMLLVGTFVVVRRRRFEQ